MRKDVAGGSGIAAIDFADTRLNTTYGATEVVLCTLNGAPYVLEQLNSILTQTIAIDRISIFDDCSTDDTMASILRWRTSLPANVADKVHVDVNSGNIGYAKNFCQAIARATGDVIFLCDQDDVWEKNKASTLLSLMMRTRSDMVFSDGSIIDDQDRIAARASVLETYGLGKRDIDAFSGIAFKTLVKRNCINGASMAVRREAALAALPLPCDMPHDYWFAIWCSLRGGIAGTSERLYRYRQHGRNAIGIGDHSLLSDCISAWHHARVPRQRELRIWTAIAERLLAINDSEALALALEKRAWLRDVLDESKGSIGRLKSIVKSLLDGKYRRLSPDRAVLRDLFALLQS